MSGPYEIRVYDNFHYMDLDESYLLGPFATAEQALQKAKEIVRDFLSESAHEHRMVEDLLNHYRMFGEDPTILGDPKLQFSAWDYAVSIAPQYGISNTAIIAPGGGASAIPEFEHGVPLRQIAEQLASAGKAVQRIARGLKFEDESGFQTFITVDEPRTQDGLDYDVESVTRVITQAPPMVAQLLSDLSDLAVANQVTALGSLNISGIATLESRLSIYENMDEWHLHGPLLVHAALLGPATFSALVNAAAGVPPVPAGPSRWSHRDLEKARETLPGECFSRLTNACLTIAVPLDRGDLPAHIHLRYDAPHPTLGSGLLCLIEAPALRHASDLSKSIATANDFELRYEDRPPHFGAWCLSATGNSLAYHQFLPDSLFDVPDVVAKVAAWAIARARANSHHY